MYVLDSHSTNGLKNQKWAPRSRVGIYLGHSRYHANTVCWVLNVKTDQISPQFHVIFDDNFTTVECQNDMSQIEIRQGLMKTSTWENMTDFQINLDDETWRPISKDPSSNYHDQNSRKIISEHNNIS